MLGEWVERRGFPRCRGGKRLRNKKRSLFERSEFKRFPQTRRPAGEAAFHGGVFFASFFPSSEKAGHCQGVFLPDGSIRPVRRNLPPAPRKSPVTGESVPGGERAFQTHSGDYGDVGE